MKDPQLRKLPLPVLVCVAIVLLSDLPAQTQNPGPATAQAVTAPHQSTQTPDSENAIRKAQLTILEDTMIRVRIIDAVSSNSAKNGTPLLFTVSEDVIAGDAIAIPRGASAHGIVVKCTKPGRLTGSPELMLELNSLDLGGRSYPLYTYEFNVKGTSKTQPTEKKIVRGAYIGAIVGSFISGVSSKGLITPEDGSSRVASEATGAGLGAGVATAVAAASPGPIIRIPSESELDFYLAAPITVTPVSAKEAAKLAEGLHPGGPVLYVRGDTP
ncbi:MAG: hypothetical protein ACLQGT_08830 [Terracidiphilus sp.]